jgi:hypothetical protein
MCIFLEGCFELTDLRHLVSEHKSLKRLHVFSCCFFFGFVFRQNTFFTDYGNRPTYFVKNSLS